MAIVICKECGKEMSDTAKICPNCGYDYTAKNRLKRKKNNKIGCLIILVLLGFFFYHVANTDPLEAEKAKLALVEKNHCKIIWSKLDKSQKTKVLEEYLEVARFSKGSPDEMLRFLIKESVKYPSSLSEISPYGEITNIEKGIIEYNGSFTSENKLSMKVKSSYFFKIKYNAGCKPFEYISFDLK